VGREEVPARLRQLLNVESGLNDGLALPIVVAMLAVIGSEHFSLGRELQWILLANSRRRSIGPSLGKLENHPKRESGASDSSAEFANNIPSLRYSGGLE
jgi:hypothetical protein